MASGWAGDGAVQDQIQDSINDEVARARRNLPKGESLHFCEECGEPIPEAQGPPRRAAVRGLSGGSRQGSARRQPLQPPRQQGQPVALKSGDGKIGESFGEGRRNPSGEGLPPPLPKPHPSTSQDFCMMGRRRGGSPRRMTEWERRGVEGGCPARFRQSPHHTPIISGGAALCAGRAVSLRRPPSGRD